MPTLKEFLAEEAEKLRGEQSDAVRKRDEWVASIDRLLSRIKEWLHDADTAQLVSFREGRVLIREVGVGDYEAPVLFVDVGVRQVSVTPVARVVAGGLSSTGAIQILKAYGRVDMASPLEKYMLFRTQKDPEDRWVIIEDNGYRSEPFNRETFESAFQRLLE